MGAVEIPKRAGALGLAAVACSVLVLMVGTIASRGARRALSAAPVASILQRASVRGRLLSSELALVDRPLAGVARRPVEVGRSNDVARNAAPPRRGVAALAGRITRDGQGASAHLSFELGCNEGIELDTAPDGSFRRAGLAPGFQLVTVAVGGRASCRRSLFLPPARESAWELDFGAPRTARVRVCEADGRPIAGATVELDGSETTTDRDGRATLEHAGSGAPELLVRAPGFAAFTCALERTESELEVRLEPACSLEVRLPDLATADEAVVYLLPLGPERLAGRPPRPATPWHLVSPLHAAAGSIVRLDDLPAGELEIRVLHRAARMRPERVQLDPSTPVSLALRTEAVPVSEREAHRAELELPGLLSSACLGSLPRLQPLVAIDGAP